MLTHPFSLKSFLNTPRLRSACSEIARVSHETGMGVGEVGGVREARGLEGRVMFQKPNKGPRGGGDPLR